MSTENTPTPAAATETAAPATEQVLGLTFGQTKLAFQAITNPRAKGAEKGAPVLLPKYVDPTGASLPDVLRHAAALGGDLFAKAVSVEVLRPLYIEASKQARVKKPDGTWSIDEGKFVQISTNLLRDFTSTQSARQKLEAELAEIEEAIAKKFAEFLEAAAKGQPVTPEYTNAANQLLLKKSEIQAKLSKRANKSAPAAATAPAPAAA